MKDDPDHWFVYSRSAGRITAAPANWKGWLALIGGVALIGVCGAIVMRASGNLHLLLRIAALSTTIAVGVLLIARLAVSKGKSAG